MVVVPPLFEAADCSASSSDTEQTVRYPILLTVETRASLLRFKMPLTSPFHKSFLIGLPPPPTLLEEINKCTPLVQRVNYLTLIYILRKFLSKVKGKIHKFFN
ncbi:hypothetical protein COJ96_17040 [Bacillus sp. AFS073361]|nr:hypothetical protein COJ96_17040 [Bacillus sp. AFS073361]